MQPLIERYPGTNFVILHASYPYTRDAGYLAAVYKNVYLDFGEVRITTSTHFIYFIFLYQIGIPLRLKLGPARRHSTDAGANSHKQDSVVK